MPQIIRFSLLAKRPVGDGGVALTEVPTLENEVRSKASHDLPERNTKYLAGVGLFRVVQKLIPTTRATSKATYKILSSAENAQE